MITGRTECAHASWRSWRAAARPCPSSCLFLVHKTMAQTCGTAAITNCTHKRTCAPSKCWSAPILPIDRSQTIAQPHSGKCCRSTTIMKCEKHPIVLARVRLRTSNQNVFIAFNLVVSRTAHTSCGYDIKCVHAQFMSFGVCVLTVSCDRPPDSICR